MRVSESRVGGRSAGRAARQGSSAVGAAKVQPASLRATRAGGGRWTVPRRGNCRCELTMAGSSPPSLDSVLPSPRPLPRLCPSPRFPSRPARQASHRPETHPLPHPLPQHTHTHTSHPSLPPLCWPTGPSPSAAPPPQPTPPIPRSGNAARPQRGRLVVQGRRRRLGPALPRARLLDARGGRPPAQARRHPRCVSSRALLRLLSLLLLGTGGLGKGSCGARRARRWRTRRGGGSNRAFALVRQEQSGAAWCHQPSLLPSELSQDGGQGRPSARRGLRAGRRMSRATKARERRETGRAAELAY